MDEDDCSSVFRFPGIYIELTDLNDTTFGQFNSPLNLAEKQKEEQDEIC